MYNTKQLEMLKGKHSIFHQMNGNKTRSSVYYTRQLEMTPTNSELPFRTLRVEVHSFLECHHSGPHHTHRKALKYLLYTAKLK